MQLVLPPSSFLLFLGIYHSSPCFIAIRDTRLEPAHTSPLPVEGAGETLQKKGCFGFRVLLLRWLLQYSVTSSLLDASWCSPSACQFWHQLWSTCTPAGFFLFALHEFPCPLASVQWLDISGPDNPANLSVIQWAMSAPFRTKSGS